MRLKPIFIRKPPQVAKGIDVAEEIIKNVSNVDKNVLVQRAGDLIHVESTSGPFSISRLFFLKQSIRGI